MAKPTWEQKRRTTCRIVAVRNGHTVEEADNCRHNSMNCPDCPFREEQIIKQYIVHNTSKRATKKVGSTEC